MSLLSSIKIRVVSNKTDWKTFYELPFKFYSHDPFWVPPLKMEERNLLNSRRNPFFNHASIRAWLAFDRSEVVGRILAFVDDNYNDFHKSKMGFFGYFESIDSQNASNALIDHASDWLIDQGMASIRGPINLSVTNECGFLVNGFSSLPFIKMGHSLPYYPNLVENYGFELEHRLLAYLITNETVNSSELWRRLEKINERALKNNEVQIRSINMDRYKEEVGHVFRIYNEFMKDNWGFVPATKAEMYFMADILKFIIDPKMVLMAEYRGEIVGCSLGVPNINQLLPELKGKLFPFGFIKLFLKRKKISNFRLMLIGVLPEFRERGFDVLLYYETIRRSLDRGYESAELSWISEENKNLRSILEKLGARLYKMYHVYEKNLMPD
jgi:GNAT superfamily N-acetyltransferase